MARTDLCPELQILELFSKSSSVTLGPTDLERFLGGSKGTHSVKLRSLADAGYLKAASGGRYRMGPKVMELGLGYLGIVMGQMDEARRLLDVNFAEVRAAVEALAAAATTVGGSKP